jgi:peroxiredoxin
MKIIATLLIMMAAFVAAADEPSVRAALKAPDQRKPAPEFVLHDRAGKSVSLAKYRGKVLLLDFWATWCTGCKKEMPWFSDFQRKYRGKGLVVIGVSMDDDGWKVVKPFLASHAVPYRILLGDEVTGHEYGIGSLPDTFLIDRQGRIAAGYTNGLVDRNDVESNLQALLAKR